MGSLVFNSGISDKAEGISAPAEFQFSHTNNRNKTTTEENASSRRSNSYSFGSAPTGPAVRADMNSVDPRLRQRIRCITSSQGMPDGPSRSRASSRRSSYSRLRAGQRQRVRCCRQAVPKLFQQVQPFSGISFGDVDRAHGEFYC